MTNPRSAEDVIILASGDSVVPAPTEDIIRSFALVKDVVIFGQGRNQVGVLIEPSAVHAIDADDEAGMTEFKNQIWAKIEEAKTQSPATFSQITREMILILTKKRSMICEGVTVQPEATLEYYKVEINNLYDRPSAWTPEGIEEWLLHHVIALRENRDDEIDVHADLFLHGFDSFNATRLLDRVCNALKHLPNPKQDHVPSNLIYQIRNIQRISLWIDALVNQGVQQARTLFDTQQKQAIDDMLKKYSIGSPGPVPDGMFEGRAVVLLTGSTGGLGSSLLYQLVQRDDVERVFALNRPSSKSIEERQNSAFSNRRIALNPLEAAKITYVQADASQKMCGLDRSVYTEIRDLVTLIIHNAWRVDFNLPLSSFEDCIQASRNLIELGLTSRERHQLRFLFTSSIASALSWGDSTEPFPEEVQTYPPVVEGTGYGASKYVTELIIANSGLRATSIRIGQIAGTYDGCWAPTDWFPMLVITSEFLHKLPKGNGVVSWLPEERVVSAILETAFGPTLPPALNLVNPESQPFDKVIEFTQKAIMKEKHLREGIVVDSEEEEEEDENEDRQSKLKKIKERHELPVIDSLKWLTSLRKKASELSNPGMTPAAWEAELKVFPAIKLLDFIGSALIVEDGAEVAGMRCSVDKMKSVSQTLRGTPWQIGRFQAEAWARYWNHKGVLHRSS